MPVCYRVSLFKALNGTDTLRVMLSPEEYHYLSSCPLAGKSKTGAVDGSPLTLICLMEGITPAP